MKNLLSLFFAISLTLSACGTAYIQSTPISTRRPTHAPSPTKTLIPSFTPRPITPTVLPKIPTFTPTFDISNIITATSAKKAECPQSNPHTNLVLMGAQSYYLDTSEVAPPILDFLNQGGDVNVLIQTVSRTYGRNGSILGYTKDVTNDEMPDVIIKYPGMLIFVCQNGQYELAYDGNVNSSYIITDDLNKNGIPEILSHFLLTNAGASIEIQEWDGVGFDTIGHVGIDGGYQYEIIDLNGDGLKEFKFRGGAPGLCCIDITTPWRYKTTAYSWDGNTYSELYTTFDKAIYRFQSVQDGDRETLLENYKIALFHYQNAIFDKTLQWWTEERKDYEVKLFYDSYNPITPTPLPYPLEDPAEYPRLAAYAYYRIMLLHLVQGQDAEAASTYQTLQETFGTDPYASPYIEMATEFWEAYQSTHKMYDGCAAAIQYAVEHPQILTSLGSDYHGSQSHTYVPADMCPFR